MSVSRTALGAAFVCVLLAGGFASPTEACLQTPANPPDVTISGDACTDGQLVVTLHDYTTFAASADNCACALNIPLLYGLVSSAAIVESATGNTVTAFNFGSDPDADFGPPGDWQGFSSAVTSVVANLNVDLVFTVIPTEVRCEDFGSILQTAIEDPPGGVIVGTGGADDDGTPDHHIALAAAGEIKVPHSSACEPSLALMPCSVDLRSGEISKGCSAFSSHYRITSPPNDSDGDGWLETVIQVDLGAKCERACVVLDYGDDPQGFTFNIGDSATNDGFGGNNGAGDNEAEAQIRNHTFTTYSIGLGPGQVDRVATQQLALSDGGYKVCVSDQTITYGQPAARATTPFSNLLFALPDSGFDGNRQIFIGLNRVVRNIGGAPTAGRTGSGLLRAHVTID